MRISQESFPCFLVGETPRLAFDAQFLRGHGPVVVADDETRQRFGLMRVAVIHHKDMLIIGGESHDRCNVHGKVAFRAGGLNPRGFDLSRDDVAGGDEP